MSLPSSFLSIDTLKEQAKRLRREREAKSSPISHSEALEQIAHQYRYKDWNTLVAAANQPKAPLSLVKDQRVHGQYLGVPFTAKVFDFQKLPAHGKYRLSLQLDEAVDIISFSSFSAFRKRIVCTVGDDGKTAEKTSNGQPQVVLFL